MVINDKIKSLKDYYNGKNASGLTALYKNEVIKGEDSFLKR